MKQTALFLAAGIMSLAANARILRVNNYTGGSTPYTTIAAALEAAADGDTIMVDASSTAYDFPKIEKSVVILGPGYNLIENGITEEGASCAQMGSFNTDRIYVTAPKAVIKGMAIPGSLYVQAEKVVVNRCFIVGAIFLEGTADNSIVHQNFVRGTVGGYTYAGAVYPSYVQVTNNIILNNIHSIRSGYIAYNTILVYDDYNMYTCYGCTIEHNWSQVELYRNERTNTNNMSDNYVSDDFAEFGRYKAGEADFAALDVPARRSYGAFAGSTPYVLSGVPAGPVIQDLVVPASVEQGSKLQVTIKVGMQP